MTRFRDSNHLAESINLSNEDGHIARNLMTSPIEHFAKGIGWYTYDGAFVREHHREMFVGSVERMAHDIKRLGALLGFQKHPVPHIRSSSHAANISARGRLNLRAWYNASDYSALRELVRFGLLDAGLYDLS